MNTKEAANERALQELASIQADIDNGRSREAYQRKLDYLNELVDDLPKDRQAHFYAEMRRLKLNPKVNQAGTADIHAPAPPPQGNDAEINDPNVPGFDPNKPVVTASSSGGISPA
jgi:hypothetical protein